MSGCSWEEEREDREDCISRRKRGGLDDEVDDNAPLKRLEFSFSGLASEELEVDFVELSQELD